MVAHHRQLSPRPDRWGGATALPRLRPADAPGIRPSRRRFSGPGRAGKVWHHTDSGHGCAHGGALSLPGAPLLAAWVRDYWPWHRGARDQQYDVGAAGAGLYPAGARYLAARHRHCPRGLAGARVWRVSPYATITGTS